MPLAAVSIYGMILPIVFLDIMLWQYQVIYFGLSNIPKIDRSQFFTLDRGKLRQLTFMQKLNCLYCAYANGVMAYGKAVTNQTEVYSCAIKHATLTSGCEHQDDFYEYEEFL